MPKSADLPVLRQALELPDAYSATLSARQLNLLMIQLQVMLGAGLPLVASLEALAGCEDLAIASVSQALADRLSSGHSLSASMARLPKTFDKVSLSMIRVGESTGRLHHVLTALSSDLTLEEKRRGRLASALIYPAMTLLVSALMVTFLIYGMLPGYLTLFSDSGGRLPFLTGCLQALTRSPGPGILLLGPFLGGFGLWMTSSRWDGPRKLLRWIQNRAPGLRSYCRRALLIRLCRSLALMNSAGMGFVEALQILATTSTGQPSMDRTLWLARERLLQGDTFCESLQGLEHIPRFLIQAVAAGEEVGRLPLMLTRWAEMMEDELSFRLEAFLQILEPMLLLGVGALVGLVVLASFLPVFSLLQTVSG